MKYVKGKNYEQHNSDLEVNASQTTMKISCLPPIVDLLFVF